jgi:pimeloyl-ACP methyl ester carboxylesterase
MYLTVQKRLTRTFRSAGMLIPLISGLLSIQTMAQSSTQGATAQANATATLQPLKKGYAPVNGLRLYYEIYGNGEPLVLLHGGLGAIEMFGANLPVLAQTRQVIAVDLQGHGRTADIDRPLNIEFMADDIAGLLKHLGIKQADFMGYSLGGGVALQTAIRHPEFVRKMVVVSTPIKRKAFYADILSQQEQMGPQAAEFMKQTPMYELYARLAPKPEDWTKLITKIGEAMKVDYDWSDKVKTIKAPTLLIAADADLFPPSHTVEIFELLGGGQRDGGWDGSGQIASQLAILPGLTHYNIFMSPALAPTALAFLDKPANKTK